MIIIVGIAILIINTKNIIGITLRVLAIVYLISILQTGEHRLFLLQVMSFIFLFSPYLLLLLFKTINFKTINFKKRRIKIDTNIKDYSKDSDENETQNENIQALANKLLELRKE